MLSDLFGVDNGLEIKSTNYIDTDISADYIKTLTSDTHHKQYAENLYANGCGFLRDRKILSGCIEQLLKQRSVAHNISVLEISTAYTEASQQITQALDSEDRYHFITNSTSAYGVAESDSRECVSTNIEHLDSFDQLKLVDVSASSTAEVGEGYDLIILNHLATASRTISSAIESVVKALKPGGTLLVAGKEDNHIDNLLFGLTPSWWSEGSLGVQGREVRKIILTHLRPKAVMRGP